MVCPSCIALGQILSAYGIPLPPQLSVSPGMQPALPVIVDTPVRDSSGDAPKKKRKATRYNRVYSKHFKALKKKHPRMAFAAISKKAHRLTKKEVR